MAFATMPLLGLSDTEHELVSRLSTQLMGNRTLLELRDDYYKGEMRILSLGVSIPPQLQGLRTVLGWPRVIVDAVDERLDVEGFRYASSTDADMDLWDIWQANNLDDESQLAHLDALVFGHSYVTVGSPDDPGDPPLICAESALDLACEWDARKRVMVAAFRGYDLTRMVLNQVSPAVLTRGTLYLPDQTIQMYRDGGDWVVDDRDMHGLGQVPVVRMVNRARIAERHGHSEITAEVMSVTDAACRTMLGMEVAREFFAAPQRYILGATESSFMDAEGNAKSAWQTYMGRILALESDAQGKAPTVGQFPAGDPSSFTSVLDTYAKIMASITGLPSDYLGINTVIPASADAIRMGTDRLINKVRRKQRAFDTAWEDAMRLALMIRDGGPVPDDAKSIETLWRNPEIPTPAATTDAMFKQVQMGAIPASSDILLERLGYSAVERERIAVDRSHDIGLQVLAELATSLQAKEARADTTVAADIHPTKPGPAAAPAVPPVPPPNAAGG